MPPNERANRKLAGAFMMARTPERDARLFGSFRRPSASFQRCFRGLVGLRLRPGQDRNSITSGGYLGLLLLLNCRRLKGTVGDVPKGIGDIAAPNNKIRQNKAGNLHALRPEPTFWIPDSQHHSLKEFSKTGAPKKDSNQRRTTARKPRQDESTPEQVKITCKPSH